MTAPSTSRLPAWQPGPFPEAQAQSSSSGTQSYDLPPHHVLADGTPDYLRLTLSADVYDLVKSTPLQTATNLSSRLGCDVFMKREDLQPVFSFKLRGAYNMMRSLQGESKWKGVIACSAGNHAQGVALSGLHLSIPCTIVMPMGTPSIKVDAVRRLGAKVVLHGTDFDGAQAECRRLATAYGLTLIPPFDHPLVIAGQGTVGVELCRQTDMSRIDAVFVCVGGGGLLAGIAAYVKRIAPPHVKVVGVETYDGDALARSLVKGQRELLKEVGLFSDGTAVRLIGEETFRVCAELVDGIVRVDTDEICAAIRDVFEDTRSVPEPAGALAVAGMKRYVTEQGLHGSGKRFAAIVSGANMNFSRLRFVAERAELGDQKEVLLMVDIPEERGSFLKLYAHIQPRNLTEFSYRMGDTNRAHIYLSFMLSGNNTGALPAPAAAASAHGPTAVHREVPSGRGTDSPGRAPSPHQAGSRQQSNPTTPTTSMEPVALEQSRARHAELDPIMRAIEADGTMRATDISDNEMAKSHARYMVGGRSGKQAENVRLFQFIFPERPGALKRFLEGLHAGWNITLFHYRNHGSDTSKVLAGLQVPPEDADAFHAYLDELGYTYQEETDNIVYKRMLA
ncbi:threonine dehydratase I [Ceraceosorus guamensis]|uniref:Threonine dehydratase n=1 Tax=Ceraceosorus guamensis TaxID=1522189 RepID=A0A316WGL9_9BASI|nr:threonine dehydratase I [Ceraceosorus guamensis]PWN46285.1 threonine dehydratase I [Ceraceosorus guamensis]